jgi:hypothetical protein
VLRFRRRFCGGVDGARRDRQPRPFANPVGSCRRATAQRSFLCQLLFRSLALFENPASIRTLLLLEPCFY